MTRIDILVANFMDFIQYIQKILFGIHMDALDTSKDFADHLLARGGIRSITQAFEVGEQLAVYKAKESTQCAHLQGQTLRAFRRSPIPPAIW